MIIDSPNVLLAVRDGPGVFRIDSGVVSSIGAGIIGLPLCVLVIPRILLRRVFIERGLRVVKLAPVFIPFWVSFVVFLHLWIGHWGCGQVALHTGTATVMIAIL